MEHNLPTEAHINEEEEHSIEILTEAILAVDAKTNKNGEPSQPDSMPEPTPVATPNLEYCSPGNSTARNTPRSVVSPNPSRIFRIRSPECLVPRRSHRLATRESVRIPLPILPEMMSSQLSAVEVLKAAKSSTHEAVDLMSWLEGTDLRTWMFGMRFGQSYKLLHNAGVVNWDDIPDDCTNLHKAGVRKDITRLLRKMKRRNASNRKYGGALTQTTSVPMTSGGKLEPIKKTFKPTVARRAGSPRGSENQLLLPKLETIDERLVDLTEAIYTLTKGLASNRSIGAKVMSAILPSDAREKLGGKMFKQQDPLGNLENDYDDIERPWLSGGTTSDSVWNGNPNAKKKIYDEEEKDDMVAIITQIVGAMANERQDNARYHPRQSLIQSGMANLFASGVPEPPVAGLRSSLLSDDPKAAWKTTKGEVEVEQEKGFWGVLFNLTNYMVGYGLFVLPYYYAKLGLFWGLFSSVFFAVGAILSVNLMGAQLINYGPANWNTLMSATMKGYESIFDIATVISYTTACVGFLTVVANQLTDVAKSFINEDSFFAGRKFAILCGALVTIPIFVGVSDINALRHLSFLSIIMILCLYGIMQYYVFSPDVDESKFSCEESGYDFWLPETTSPWEVIKLLPGFVSIYHCHLLFFTAAGQSQRKDGTTLKGMRAESQQTFFRLGLGSVGFAALIYISFGVAAYLKFGRDVADDVVGCLPSDDAIMYFIRVFIALKFLTSIPLLLTPLRECVSIVIWSWWIDDGEQERSAKTFSVLDEMSDGLYRIVTIFCCVVPFGIALFVSSLSMVVSFFGAVVGFLYVYILPGYFYASNSFGTLQKPGSAIVISLFMEYMGLILAPSALVIMILAAIYPSSGAFH